MFDTTAVLFYLAKVPLLLIKTHALLLGKNLCGHQKNPTYRYYYI